MTDEELLADLAPHLATDGGTDAMQTRIVRLFGLARSLHERISIAKRDRADIRAVLTEADAETADLPLRDAIMHIGTKAACLVAANRAADTARTETARLREEVARLQRERDAAREDEASAAGTITDLQREIAGMKATLANQLQVTVVARQAVADVVIERNTARTSLASALTALDDAATLLASEGYEDQANALRAQGGVHVIGNAGPSPLAAALAERDALAVRVRVMEPVVEAALFQFECASAYDDEVEAQDCERENAELRYVEWNAAASATENAANTYRAGTPAAAPRTLDDLTLADLQLLHQGLAVIGEQDRVDLKLVDRWRSLLVRVGEAAVRVAEDDQGKGTRSE